MKFSFSLRAFLIASGLVGGLYLLLILIKLNTQPQTPLQEEHPISYEIEENTSNDNETQKIKTHRAFNENLKFIEQQEQNREQAQEQTQDKIDQINQSINATKNPSQKDLSLNTNKNKTSTDPEEINIGNSTIRYSLINRSALLLPNPVYTCENPGKIVIQITVAPTGIVQDTQYNKSASTSENNCLIDQALRYAKKARFTSVRTSKEQKGSITFYFPGQSN